MVLDERMVRECMKACIDAAQLEGVRIRRPHVGALVLSRYGTPVGIGNKQIIPGAKKMYLHAERVALAQAGEKAQGGTLFTTLEPCIQISETSVFKPCTRLILEYGIEQVVIGIPDSSPLINGKGAIFLQAAGIKVEFYKADAEELQLLRQLDYCGK